MAFFGRMAWGAAAGAGLGYMGTGTLAGTLGGAAGGAVAGGPGVYMGRGIVDKYYKGGLARAARAGLGYGTRGADWAMGKLATNRMTRGAFDRYMPYRRREAMANAIMGANSWIGRNAATTNKVGGYALAALGTYSAANMGANLASNRGF